MQNMQVCAAVIWITPVLTLDRAAHDADPAGWDPRVRYEYKRSCSTTSLRPHIEKHHLELYLELQKERGWEILLPTLVSQARSQARSTDMSAQERVRDKFDEDTFHRYLVNFVVADDQVCLCIFWLRPDSLIFVVFERH